MEDTKRCQSCLYWLPLASNNNIMACHYCFFNGHSRDKGEKCGSYEKKTEKRKRVLKQIQEDKFHNPERRGKTDYERSFIL